MSSKSIQPGFKIKFDFDNYRRLGVVPDIEEYLKNDEIINAEAYKKGNVHECIWKKETPIIVTPEYEAIQIRRMFTGAWIYIKDCLIWIPPNMYFKLMCCQAGGAAPQFRLKRLKHCYFKIWVRNNPKALGTYTMKNRQDGETSDAVGDALHEVRQGNLNKGNIGMQSKTRETVRDSCWRNLIMHWDFMQDWVKKYLYSDVLNDRAEMATTLKFLSQRTDTFEGRDILMKYAPSVYNAMDSMSNILRCILDEVNKWEECSFYETFINYKQFVAAGSNRKGIFDIFSSPADKPGKHNEDAYTFWQNSKWWDTAMDGISVNKEAADEYKKNGTTPTRIFAYFSNPLDGIEGQYDMWGDANPQDIYDWIMRERKNTPIKYKQREIRANPLNEQEMFGTFDTGAVWSNHSGILARQQHLATIRVKDDNTKEPKCLYGNLEWPGGIQDSGIPIFRQADVHGFDVVQARFCFSYIPYQYDNMPLEDTRVPPKLVESCWGIDPFNNRYAAKNPSNQSTGAGVLYKFRDLFDTKVYNVMPAYYNCRPYHINVFFEDMIMLAVYCRAMVQYENRSDKLENYFEDRGYMNWLLPEIGAAPGSKRKGDSPDSKGKFLNGAMGLLDVFTNKPYKEGEQYNLDYLWFEEMCADWLAFDPRDTEKSNITMATLQALTGAVKIMHRKIRKPSDFNAEVLSYLFS